jgi:hypothetical protein
MIIKVFGVWGFGCTHGHMLTAARPNRRHCSLQVFTDTMFAELATDMRKLGWDDAGGVAATEVLWKKEFRDRKIIAEFMKDGTLGDKRLASMPDRTTNTILTADGPVYRPAVINCYGGDLGSTRAWWEQWRRFIFTQNVRLNNKGTVEEKPVSSLLIPIKRSKFATVPRYAQHCPFQFALNVLVIESVFPV